MVPALAEKLAPRLSTVAGVVAVALGGSYARGTQQPDSDIDLGLYYRDASPIAVEELRALAEELNDEPGPVVTEIGRWGPWVNGGAWLTVGGQRVDWLYRSLDLVERVIRECREGRLQSDFYQQVPYGFHSYIYLGELSVCKPLRDPEGVLAELKRRIVPYPEPLKRAIIDRFLWAAEFALPQAKKFAEGEDTYNAVGSMARVASALVQVLYALNERYFVHDKGALAEIEGFRLKPERFRATVSESLSPSGPGSLVDAAGRLDGVLQQTLTLCEGTYVRPEFRR